MRLMAEMVFGVHDACHRLLAFTFLIVCSTLMTAQTARVDTLQEVVVTGTGTQHLLKNAPVQTEVITRKMLESYSGKSVEEILGGLTASFAFNEGDMGSQMQLGGLGNSYILVLVDGKRLHGDTGGENDLGLIDPHNIERIEIVKGAQSALYGSDAIAGVINIITRKHDKHALSLENTTRYSGGVGMPYDVRQHNGVGFGIGKVQSYTNFQLQTSSGWQNTSEEYAEAQVLTDSRNRTVNRFLNWQVAEHLTYTPVKGLELYADGTIYRKDIMRPQNGTHASCDVYTYDLMYRNASASVGGKWLVGKALTPQRQNAVTLDVDWNRHAYYYNFTKRTLTDGYDRNGEFTNYCPYYPGDRNLQADQQRVMANVKGVFYLPAGNTLTGGAEYRYDYLHAPMRVYGGSASDWTAALYLQDEFALIPWLNVTAGLRLNGNAAFGFHASPKVSTMFSVGDFRIRLGWSQGFKTPTPKELNYRYVRRMGANTYYYMGNKDLRPQTSNYVSAGAEYRGRRLTASVTAYYNKLDNMITLVNIPISEIPPGATGEFMGDGSGQIIPRMYKNAERAKTYGVDVNLSWNITPDITIGGNYSYLNTDAYVYNNDTQMLDNVVIDGMAHHKWNAYATWRKTICPAYRLTIGLYTRGSSERFYQDNGNGKPFQIWRLTTGHDFGKRSAPVTYRCEVGVDNIFNYVDRTMRPYHLGTTANGTSLVATFSVKFNKGKKINQQIKKQTSYEED